jgi:hypothetical protein
MQYITVLSVVGLCVIQALAASTTTKTTSYSYPNPNPKSTGYIGLGTFEDTSADTCMKHHQLYDMAILN